jgi:hypothetical protein
MKTQMGMVVAVAALVMMATATPVGAQAQIDTGRTLLADLQQCEHQEGEVASIFRCARAMGRVNGAADTFTLLLTAVCQPSGVTNGQVVDLVKRFIRDHPEREHEDDVTLIGGALIAAWPCPARAVQQGQK